MIVCHNAATTKAAEIQISMKITALICFWFVLFGERVSVRGSLPTSPSLSVGVTSIKSNAVLVLKVAVVCWNNKYFFGYLITYFDV